MSTRPRTRLTEAKNAYEHPQPHACFIQSVGDDLVNDGGIMDLWVREARLFKYGSGTGTNFSNLRGSGETLSGGGNSSGLMSFLRIGDRAAGAIKSGGTTRRAAKMVCLDLDHPDVIEFIDWKVVEEQKGRRVGGRLKDHQAAAYMKFSMPPVSPAITGTRYTRPIRKRTRKLKDAIRTAKRLSVPLGYIKKVLDLAPQGVSRYSTLSIWIPTGTAKHI